MENAGTIALRWHIVKDSLNEDQRRLWLASEAQALGGGGISTVARAAGVSRTTVARGLERIEELKYGDVKPAALKPAVRQRRQGGGRRSLVAGQPGILDSLLALVESEPIRGRAPPLLWTTKSREKLAEALCEAGHRVRGPALGELLKAQGFRVRGSSTFVGHLPRPVPGEQFQFINDRLVGALQSGWPVLGVELFRIKRHSVPRDDEPGLTYARYRRHDDRFADEAPAREESVDCEVCGASKFNLGRLSDPDMTTVNLAAQALKNWWDTVGSAAFVGAERLVLVIGGLASEEMLVTRFFDALKDLAREKALPLEVLRLPAGTSRWRTVVQRFSLAMNCYEVGRDLERHEVILERPVSCVPRQARTESHRSLSADAVATEGLGSGADVTVDSERMKSYPTWNRFIAAE